MPVVDLSEVDTTTERILIVDDSPQILSVVSEVFAYHGFEVVTAMQGSEALAQMRALHPAAIICDVMMPDMDGYQVFAEVQGIPELSEIPFLFLTALNNKADVRLAKELGCDDYIVKPFDPDELLAAVRGRIALASRRKASFESRMKLYRKRVVQTLSHEFRTPLVAISTGTELLIEQFQTMNPAVMQKLLQAIKRGGTRLQELVESFIILQQVENGKEEENFRRFRHKTDLSALTLTCVNEMSVEHGEVTFRYSPKPTSAAYVVDIYSAHFHSSLRRILDNAIKFAGVEKTIDVSVNSNQTHVWVIVRDYGPGLPQSAFELAQQMFMQIDREKQEQQGCGLGLSIASAYVHINQGELRFSQPQNGPGLEVTIRFPRTLPLRFN